MKENSQPTHNVHYSQQDLEYMSSLSSAVLQKSTKSYQILLWVIFGTASWLLAWAYFADIDEITRGEAKVIPSGHIQVIQNLEGGIVSDILVQEGDTVKKGEILLRIDNQKSVSSYEESQSKYNELHAKSIRLQAEALDKPFTIDKDVEKDLGRFIIDERSLYESHKKELTSEVGVLKEQLSQRDSELKEATSKLKRLKGSYKLMREELKITEPLVRKGLESKVDFLKLKRDVNDLLEKVEAASISLPRMESSVSEIRSKIEQTRLIFKNEAKRELNEVLSEMDRIGQTQSALADQVNRTAVESSVDGVVKQIFINTVGGVIKPGMDLLEIVPNQDTLIIEAKIKPSDIAFLYPGQKAMVKITAYDFGIYGGLDGEVSRISADTITDRKENSYYLVRIKTDRSYLGGANGDIKDSEKKMIIPGMTATVDILTGKKSVLDYLLKPILKAQQNALTER